MSSNGHRATGLALATGTALVVWQQGFPLYAVIMFGVGIMMGCRAPDWLEIVRFGQSGRSSLIPHRTVTHSPWLWVALAAVVAWASASPLSWLMAGFVVGGFLHLVTDVITPAGIPLGNPFGRRFSLKLCRTGSPGEVLVAMAVVCVMAVAVHLLILR